MFFCSTVLHARQTQGNWLGLIMQMNYALIKFLVRITVVIVRVTDSQKVLQ